MIRIPGYNCQQPGPRDDLDPCAYPRSYSEMRAAWLRWQRGTQDADLVRIVEGHLAAGRLLSDGTVVMVWQGAADGSRGKWVREADSD